MFGCSADHVNGTEYAISQIRGIYIVTGEDTFVASQWDDQERGGKISDHGKLRQRIRRLLKEIR